MMVYKTLVERPFLPPKKGVVSFPHVFSLQKLHFLILLQFLRIIIMWLIIVQSRSLSSTERCYSFDKHIQSILVKRLTFIFWELAKSCSRYLLLAYSLSNLSLIGNDDSFFFSLLTFKRFSHSFFDFWLLQVSFDWRNCSNRFSHLLMILIGHAYSSSPPVF